MTSGYICAFCKGLPRKILQKNLRCFKNILSHKCGIQIFSGWKQQSRHTCYWLRTVFILSNVFTVLVTAIYTGCPRRNVPDFGRVFLMLKYTDITQNTYVHSLTVTEIMAREKCGFLAGPRTVPVSWQHYPCPSLNVVSYYGNSAQGRSRLLTYFLLGDNVGHVSAWHSFLV